MAAIKLSEWAKLNGICYKTAWRWFHQGIIPSRAIQLPTGTILVYEDDANEPKGESKKTE